MNRLAVFLKIKQESLALEIKLIKREMTKYRYDLVSVIDYADVKETNKMRVYDGLSHHLRDVVRIENRATNIARAYLRGKPYEYVESKIKKDKFVLYQNQQKTNRVYLYDPIDRKVWGRVIDIVRKYEMPASYYTDKQTPRQEISESVLLWRNEHPQFKPKEKVSNTTQVSASV